MIRCPPGLTEPGQRAFRAALADLQDRRVWRPAYEVALRRYARAVDISWRVRREWERLDCPAEQAWVRVMVDADRHAADMGVRLGVEGPLKGRVGRPPGSQPLDTLQPPSRLRVLSAKHGEPEPGGA